MDTIFSKLDEVGKPIWIALMVIGFIWFWPMGLVILAYLLWSGRLGAKSNVFVMPWSKGFWTSGNEAFDEHRREVLEQVEKEQAAFAGFAEKLRKAKDKSEFDQFMADQKKATKAKE